MKWMGFAGAGFLLIFGLAARSQEPAGETGQKKVIEKAPMKTTAAHSGEEMYREYCAVCHGKTGKGDGPAASELKTAPTDLSVLAKNNGGKFPSAHVIAVLRFGTSVPAHGTSDMPIWGRMLGWNPTTGANQAEMHLRIHNLTEYIETLQVK